MNITLIGMPGAGKSFIGKKLAKKIKYKFIDIDERIKKKTKLSLQYIINNLGEDKFLDIEEKTILELGDFNNCIISPGGSVIYLPKAMKFLKKNSIIVFLDVSFEIIKKRITNQETRAIIGLKKKTLKTIFNERLILYKKYADITIKIFNNSGSDVVIKNIIQKLIKIEPLLF